MRRALIAALLLMGTFGFAVEVAEDELEELGTRDFDFVNYQGPYETINTVDEILGIGRSLGRAVRDGRSDFVVDGRYRVIHAVDASTGGLLDADIIVPLPTARVDHINNLRRIVSGYLQTAYDYRAADADLLARWITVYNAVTRGDLAFFQTRYKRVVTSHLSAANAGLARRYDEWPGKSRIVIPLGSLAGPGVLGTVDPREIGDSRVIEELRAAEDRGVEDRQAMVDLTERVVDEREARIEDEAADIEEADRRIAEDAAALEDEREAIADERERIATLPDVEREASEADLATREREADEREDDLDADRAAVDARREDVAADRQDVAELLDQVRAEREQIASDARALLDERDIADEVRGLDAGLIPVYFLQVREVGTAVFGRLVQINPTTGLVINRSAEDAIVSREYTFFADNLLVVIAEADAGRLGLFNVATLQEVRRSAATVFPATSVEIHGTPARAYAVTRDTDQWYLGRFNEALELVDRSVVAVNPYTTIAFGGDRIWIQTADDRIVPLDMATLRISP